MRIKEAKKLRKAELNAKREAKELPEKAAKVCTEVMQSSQFPCCNIHLQGASAPRAVFEGFEFNSKCYFDSKPLTVLEMELSKAGDCFLH